MATSSFKFTTLDERHSWPRCHSRKEKKIVRSGSAMSELCDYNDDTEIIQHLKRKRSTALASLTRKRNKVEPLLIDSIENLSEVNLKMDGYIAAFDKFCDACDAYDNVIHDGEEKANAFMYFVDVKKRYLEFCQTVTAWATSMEAKLSTAKSASRASSKSASRVSSKSASIASSKSTSTSILTASRIAELEARKASIERRQELHERELRLREQRIKIGMERERLDLEDELKSLKAKDRSPSLKPKLERSVKEKSSSKSSPTSKNPSRKETLEKTSQTKAANFIPSEFYKYSHDRDVLEQQNKIWNDIVLQQQRATLPKQHVPKFTGDPLEYCSFVRAFDTLIASKEPDFSSKLYYLEQYTSGRPQELVKSCLHMNPEEGYKKARDLLDTRFGDKYKIAMAHVEKLLEVSPIRPEDADALEKFSISLTSCKNALEGIGYLNKIENPDVMRKIIEKLPYRYQDKWRDIADNIINVKHREVTMEDIALFVEQRARCLNNPIFGKLSSSSKQRTERSQVKFKPTTSPRTFATQAKETMPIEKIVTKKSCQDCNGDHTLVNCPAFKEKTYKEKMDIVSKNRLCFSCLRKGHQSVSCFKKTPCSHCSRKHNTLLHSDAPFTPNTNLLASTRAFTSTQTSSSSNGSPVSTQVTATPASISSQTPYVRAAGQRSFASSVTATQAKSSSAVLPILPVTVKGQGANTSIQTYALLDTGSNASFCSESLIKRLGVNGKSSKIRLTTIGESSTIETRAIHGLTVSDLDSNISINLPVVLLRPTIPISKDEIPSQADVDSWPEFSDNLHLQFIDSEVDLLIGMDVPEALQPIEVLRTIDDGPYAVKVKLGWVINGPTGRNVINTPPRSFQAAMQCLECADLLETDTYSISEKFTKEESVFIESVEKSINHLQDGHYEVSLPLKDQSVVLPNNRVQAERRCAYLKKRLMNNPDFKQDYVAFMKDMINKGYARKVPKEQLSGIKGKIWYIPHHGVYHKKKPGKIRIVFDCSCKYQGIALNDVLLQGPDLTSSLLGVLLRFRQESVALMADIEGMFLQVRVPEAERNLLRFLWWTDAELDREPDEYQMNVHLFGAVSSPSCANFVLRHNANINRALFQDEVVSTVFKNFYVDDCLKSLPSAEKAIQFVDGICRLMEDGGFRLTKWISSSRQVLQSIPESEQAKEVKELDFACEELPTERALGVTWLVETDSFSFKTAINERSLTRRGLLSVVSSVFDPLGMAAPFTLTAKIILQDLTRLKLQWDEIIPDQYLSPWQKWLQDLPKLGKFSLDRCYRPSKPEEGCTLYELHHFADASQQAYGAVSYLRIVNTDGSSVNNVHSSFVMAKSRLAPLKTQSIPRLELTAAALSVKLDRTLRTELEVPIQNSSFWTDSTTVLKYIMNESRKFHTYVANRVTYIRSSSSIDQWNYIDTKSNPADACTRGMTIEDFLSSKDWKTGPEFLRHDSIKGQPHPNDVYATLDEDPEVKKERLAFNTVVNEDPLEVIFKKFSSYLRLKKFIALCLRVQARFVARKKNTQVYYPSLISVNEIRHAEQEIIRYIQNKAYPQEIADLAKGTNIKRTSQIIKLDPFLKNGLLRVGGRLRNSSLPYNSKHQIIVPKNSHVAQLVTTEAHVLSGHSGRQYVLSLVRQRAWIVHANAITRKVLSDCLECRRRYRKPNEQKMADLPATRISPDKPPFTNTGVDYFGPFMVKLKRSLVKRYGVVFTCFAVRAVHIEVASSLETDTFILALRRFIARRGQVKRIYSDNGTNLVGGERELREAIQQWNNEQIHEFLLQKEIEWHFNPPFASHFGGTWERCIRTIRKVLNAVSNEQHLDDESLLTLVVEVESIINGRPLTKSSEDPNDEESLTPNHLLLLNNEPSLPPGIFLESDLYVRKRWRQVQYLTELFWKRWKVEYLHLLQQRTKWMLSKTNVKINDIVLIVDDPSPRNVWPLGRITKVIPDSQGFVRRAIIKTAKGCFERPIHKLCLLEASLD